MECVLASMLEAITQSIGQIGDAIDLVGSRLDVVFDSPVSHGFRVGIQNNVTGSIVVITWLTNTANIDEQLLVAELVLVIALIGRNELALGREDTWQVRVPHEAIVLDLAEQDLHLALIENVFRENVLVGRVAGRTVNKSELTFVDMTRQLAQKVPTLIDLHGRPRTVVELVAGPIDRRAAPWG